MMPAKVRFVLLAVIFSAAFTTAQAQLEPDVPALWKELTANRSAIALAGADATLKQWGRRTHPLHLQ